MKTYIITSKNPNYNGDTYGIRFSNGKALLNEETIDPVLKFSVEELVGRFQRDLNGYTVVEMKDKKEK